MLENTFCHIPGIGQKLETLLWHDGVTSWQQLLQASHLPVSPKREERLRDHCNRSIDALASKNHTWFSTSLPSSQQWRMYPQFSHNTAFIDIETTGLSPDHDHITTIALYDGINMRTFIHGINLDDFKTAIEPFDLLVTFNGKSFDIPFIRQALNIDMHQAHIDLRYVLASLGYAGGLKQIERKFDLDRAGLAEVDGFFAVRLWFDYINNGNQKALDTLLAYNLLDVVNLAVLMAHTYNLKTQETPFAASHQIKVPQVPQITDLPFQPDSATIQRLQSSGHHHSSGWI